MKTRRIVPVIFAFIVQFGLVNGQSAYSVITFNAYHYVSFRTDDLPIDSLYQLVSSNAHNQLKVDGLIPVYPDTIEINDRWSRPPFNNRKISHLKSRLEHKELKYLIWIEANLYFKSLVEHFQKPQVVVVAKVYNSDFKLIYKGKSRAKVRGFFFTTYDDTDPDGNAYYELTRGEYLEILRKALESIRLH